MQEDYIEIVAGMTGAQLIEALNGNNVYSKQLINALAEQVLLRVLGNNIKQIKSENNNLFINELQNF